MSGRLPMSTLVSDWRVRPGPDGVHIFRRRDGLNVLVEAEVPEARWARGPRQISVALTNACDLRCAYCYAPKRPASLPPELVVQWLSELDRAGTLGVGFGGGEPTLHPRFTWICREVARGTGLAVTFTTHAHRVTASMCRELDGQVHFIRVSMDGTGSTYERLRGRPFADLMERVRLLSAIAPIGINTVVNADTVGGLDAVVETAERVGAVELLLLPEQPVRERPGIDPATTSVLREWVNRYRGPLRLAVSEAGAEGLPTADPLPRDRGLRSYAHIDARGTLKPSSFALDGALIGAGGVIVAVRALEFGLEERL